MKLLNLIKNYIILTYQRLKSDTPRYWRRLSNVGLVITLLSGFLTENDAIIPEKYKFITKYVTSMAAAVAIVTRFATKDKELSEKSEDALLKENADKPLKDI